MVHNQPPLLGTPAVVILFTCSYIDSLLMMLI